MNMILKHLRVTQILIIIIFSAGATLAYKQNVVTKSKSAAIIKEFHKISDSDTYIFMVTTSWCGACKKSIPYLEQLKSELNIPIYALLYGETEEKYRAWYKDKKLFKKIIDNQELTKLLTSKSIPQIYVVHNNKVLYINNSIDNESLTKIRNYLK